MTEQNRINEMSKEELEKFQMKLYEELEKVSSRRPSSLWSNQCYQMLRFHSQKAKAVVSIAELVSKVADLLKQRIMHGN